jgi:hypothetical protein
VVIPAHDEAAGIGRLLSALLVTPGGVEPPAEIVVVANGCTDDTADRAREFGPAVTVLETSRASKAFALELGDARCALFPRAYVDADVVLDAASLSALADALERPDVHAAGPRRVFRMEHSSWGVRAYYHAWQALPATRAGLWGRGVVVVDGVGHERLATLPHVMSDDLAMSLLFAPHERVVVPDATAVIVAPRTLAALVRRRTRSVTGNAELETLGMNRSGERTTRADLLRTLVRSPSTAPGLVLVVLVGLLARGRSARAAARGEVPTWDRDDSRTVEDTGGAT